MIATRTPFRISFAGGGSDLRSFYSRHPGCVLSTSIDKYMYLLVHPFFDQKIQVKYSRTELVDRADQIQHPIVRVVLQELGIDGVDINSIADIPAGTGLGTSGSFTVGLLHALYAYAGKFASKEHLARKAVEIEMDVLREPIGKQDQYAAAYGGLNLITFHPDESVVVEPVVMPPGCQRRLMENLAVFYLGGARSARNILCDQQETVEREKQAFDSLVRMTEIARELRQSLARGDIDAMGPALDENWRLKNRLSRQISKDWIDDCYEKAKRSGAAGGKLLGAGGGGFLLLYCQKDRQPQLAQTLGQFRKIRFAFENVGTSIIHYEGSEE